MWAWGQFLDHEIDLTGADGDEVSSKTPDDDPVLPGAKIEFKHSNFDETTGTEKDNPQQQINQISPIKKKRKSGRHGFPILLNAIPALEQFRIMSLSLRNIVGRP